MAQVQIVQDSGYLRPSFKALNDTQYEARKDVKTKNGPPNSV